MLIDATGKFLKTKTEIPMSRDQVRMFVEFEQMLDRMGLAYQLRCRECNKIDPTADGCWGANTSTATKYVVECRHATRVYQGADAPLPTH